MDAVLVVGPDDEERMGIARALDGAGYEVHEAQDEAGALALLDERPVALVVVAEETPPGPDLIGRLRARTPAPLLVIGQEGVVTEMEALSHGADHYERRPLR